MTDLQNGLAVMRAVGRLTGPPHLEIDHRDRESVRRLKRKLDDATSNGARAYKRYWRLKGKTK